MTIPRPTFYQNYANLPGLLDPRSTFTRSTTGTVIDRMGVLRTVPANQPRHEFDPITGAPRGVLIEDARTNLWLNSENPLASMSLNFITITSDSIAAPNGLNTADTMVATSTASWIGEAVSISLNAPVTVSGYFKALVSGFVRMQLNGATGVSNAWFNLISGVVSSTTSGSGDTIYSGASIEALANGWYRCRLSVTTSGITSITPYVRPVAADGGVSANLESCYVWGRQFEAAPGVSSYIPTAGAAVTRATDGLRANINAGNTWFSATEGTMLVEWVGGGLNHTVHLAGIANGFNDSIYLTQSMTGISMTVLSGGVAQMNDLIAITNTRGTIHRLAMAWAANNFAMCVNGSVPLVDALGTVPISPSWIRIGTSPWGSADGGDSGGHPTRIFGYWNKRLDNATLQLLTK